MVSIGIIIAFGIALVAITRAVAPESPRLLQILLGGYALRLILGFGIRELSFFSYGTGGDSYQYEEYAGFIARIWEHSSIHFVDGNEFPALGPTSLPSNLFALVLYAGGRDARMGCIALVAFASALLFLNLHSLGQTFGAKPQDALRIVALLYFSPLVLFYTCDTYKDGLVACFTVGAVGSAIRLGRAFSLVHVAVGLACLLALWYVRFYLVFVTTAPLFVGLSGIRSRSWIRPVLFTLVFLGAAVVLAAYTDILQTTTERAAETFAQGTSRVVIEANSQSGSSVTFDDGGNPFGAFGPKLVYTLFSPFPWSGGSIGFQIGKLDALLWYYLVYRAVKAAQSHWKAEPTLILMFLAFLVPCTIMYATSVANVGIIIRQRIVIVLVTSILAMLYRRTPAGAVAEESAAP